MTDNITLNLNSSNGPVIATDEISGSHYQIIKQAFGADSSVTLVDASNGLPVEVINPDLSTAANQVIISGKLTDQLSAIGEVQTNPTANTLLDRIKTVNDTLNDEVLIKIKDDAIFDAFGRIRTSNSVTLFDYTNEYDSNPLIFTDYTNLGAAVTYTQNRSSVILTTESSAANARALRQTKQYFKYQPGKSQYIKISGVIRYGAVPSGSAEAHLGYFDDDDGLLFGIDSTGLFVAIRSSIGGAGVTTKIHQTDWNIDKFDGTGVSGITIDSAKSQLFIIDFQWLSVGTVRFGFGINGKVYYCHKVHHANMITGAYMRTPNLPIRFEVLNGNTEGLNIGLESISASVESEGGQDQSHYQFSAITSSAKSCGNGSITPVISLRVKDTFNGKKWYGCTHLEEFEAFVSTNSCTWYIIWNGTLTNASFASVNSYSGIEYDTSATSMTGGLILSSGFMNEGQSNKGLAQHINILNKLILSRTYSNTRDIFTLACAGISGTSNVRASINFTEDY